jgi:alpha-tubulin suppressor-like RCC1 family protein
MVSTGADHTCGITSSNELRCWGNNDSGQLGDGTDTNSSFPVTIDPDHTYTQISSGGNSNCGITSDGALKCWGKNHNGQLGDGTTTTKNTPTTIDSLTSYSKIFTSTGGDNPSGGHVCGLIGTGSRKCWGYNQFGQLGNGSRIYSFPWPVLP